ncbi:MAG: EutN/CcmL family microcompartment protein [Actinobacteria bacterium]|nr:EutN/CcmL family microcompartment protein [Actinomycetota bacterium]
MKMIKVIGSITSTIKDKFLEGFKILLVQSVNTDLSVKKDYYVVVDTVGMGEGEIGLMVTGSTATKTEITKNTSLDGTIVAKVERIDLS